MNIIYAVGVMQLDSPDSKNYPIKRTRLWHLFANFDEAEQCVLQNRGDIFERYYNFALIEETYVIDKNDPPLEGQFSGMPREWWYYADFANPKDGDPNEPTVSLCEKPKSLDRTVYFWVG